MFRNRKATSTRFISLLLALIFSMNQGFGLAPKREFYQVKIYHLKDNSQKERLETYLKQAYLPALQDRKSVV